MPESVRTNNLLLPKLRPYGSCCNKSLFARAKQERLGWNAHCWFPAAVAGVEAALAEVLCAAAATKVSCGASAHAPIC